MAASTTKRGMFITFEGGEGSGKSTQARVLAERLRAPATRSFSPASRAAPPSPSTCARLILDPGTPPHGALSEALLFYAARADHLDAVIRPALVAGRWVISRSLLDSTRVYQGAAGRADPEVIDRWRARRRL